MMGPRHRSSRPLAGLVLAAFLALLPGAGSAQAAEERLGRLFHTPEQRRQLDHLRSLGAGRPGVEERPVLRLDGVLRHPDGRVSTWINGQPAQPGVVAPGPGPGQARIATEAGKTVDLRVGDSLPAGGDTPEGLLGEGRVRRDEPRR
jgi:hypothetical protein